MDYLAALATTDLAYSVILDHTSQQVCPQEAEDEQVRSSTQSTPGPHASIKSVRSSILHPFTSESVHEVTSKFHTRILLAHIATLMVLGTSKGKRGRGKSRSLKLAKLKNQGVRLPIQICKVSGRPYGEASEKFTSELGIVTRQFAPQNVPSWTDISEEDKETLVAYLQEGFKFTNEPYAIGFILNLMHDRYKSYRHDLRQRFRSFPTMESALADPPENMEKETWKFLCEKWSDKDYKVRCGKNKLNREKLKVLHTAGSKAFRKVQYDERDRATGEELGLVELYKKTHFSEKKEAWVHADAEIRHYKLEKRQEKAIEEGSCSISDEQLSIEVFGQKVGYIRGLGRCRKPSTTLSGKLTRAQLERNNEAATREAEEQRRINEELVGRIQILESDRTEYNAKVDFLMQQISQRCFVVFQKCGGMLELLLILSEVRPECTNVPKTKFQIKHRGYTAPEYAIRGELSEKADIYSFGVLVLEIISCRKNTDLNLPSEMQYLPEYVGMAWKLYERSSVIDLVDPKMQEDGFVEKDVLRAIHDAAFLCLQPHANLRPPMSEIVAILTCKGEMIRTPMKPAFTDRRRRKDEKLSWDIISEAFPSPLKSLWLGICKQPAQHMGAVLCLLDLPLYRSNIGCMGFPYSLSSPNKGEESLKRPKRISLIVICVNEDNSRLGLFAA
ncbi:unnamed protein product [Camellia sinensis]